MTCNYNTIEAEAKEIEYKNLNVTFYVLSTSTTLYHTYQLLNCTGHIQLTINYSTIEMEAEEIEYKM